MPEIFSARRAKQEHDHEAFQAQLYQQIGPLKVELAWVKKKLVLPPDAKREWIEPEHPQISMARQCDLVGLPRSTYDYPIVSGSIFARRWSFQMQAVNMRDQCSFRGPATEVETQHLIRPLGRGSSNPQADQ